MSYPIMAQGLRDSLGTLSVDELRAAVGEQLREMRQYATQYPWLHSVYEDYVIVSCDSKFYRHAYSVNGSAITLAATREEVRITWAADTVTTQLAESGRRNRGAYIKQEGGLREAIEPSIPNEAGISEGCVLLREGVNKSRRRRYTSDFIRESLPRFDGAICHADHPTNSEARERPERTVLTMAAVVHNPRWVETVSEGATAGGAVLGDLEYLDTDAGRNMRAAFANEAVRSQAGLSIFWPGAVKIKREKLGEAYVDVPLELLGEGKLNVDFVTRPNAGGRVGPLRESEADMDIADVTLELLEAERPDLLEAARKGFVPEPKPEAKPEPQPQTGMSEADRAKFEAMERRILRADARDVVDAVLSEAGAPEAVATEVRAQFAESECSDPEQFKPLVVAVVERVTKLAESLQPKGVRGVVAEPKPTGSEGAVDVNKVMAEAMGVK